MSSPTDSGLYPTSSAWLGDMPEHWGVRRLKYIVDFCGGGTPPKSEEEFWGGDIPWVSPKDMKSGLIEDTEDHITEAAVRARAARIVPAGAVLLVVRSGILRHSIPVAIAGRRVTLNQDIKALIPKGNCEPRYLKYTIQGRQQALRLAWTKTGATVESVEHELLANTLFPVPPLDEQRAIADFLDEKTAAIDELISKKERLIELIEEKRQATITRAVTKGLDPDVPMKEAQSEWLDRIPVHWKELRLKRFVDMRSGNSITSDAIEESGKYPVYGGNGLRGFTSEYTHIGERVLIGRQGAHCGNVHRVSGRFWASEHAIVVTPRQPCCISWLTELLRVMNLNQYSIAAAQPGLAVERILMLHAPLPPAEDQRRIGDEVERVRASADHFIGRARDQITKLREYRQALISAAVTGQIDVRSRAARALDPTAPEPLEEVLT